MSITCVCAYFNVVYISIIISITYSVFCDHYYTGNGACMCNLKGSDCTLLWFSCGRHRLVHCINTVIRDIWWHGNHTWKSGNLFDKSTTDVIGKVHCKQFSNNGCTDVSVIWRREVRIGNVYRPGNVLSSADMAEKAAHSKQRFQLFVYSL